MLTPTYLTTNQSEECPQADHALLNHYYKTPHYPLQVWTHSFEGISLLCPPLPGKAIKLFFSTSPKTLSLKINLVSGYRSRIQLQYMALEIIIRIFDFKSKGESLRSFRDKSDI